MNVEKIKISYIQILFILILIILGIFSFINEAKAEEIIYQQGGTGSTQTWGGGGVTTNKANGVFFSTSTDFTINKITWRYLCFTGGSYDQPCNLTTPVKLEIYKGGSSSTNLGTLDYSITQNKLLDTVGNTFKFIEFTINDGYTFENGVNYQVFMILDSGLSVYPSTYLINDDTSNLNGVGTGIYSDTSLSSLSERGRLGRYNLIYDTTITPSNTQTRIEWISPATSTASTTYNVQLKYYFNSETDSTSTFDKILLQICPINFDGECYENSANITYNNLLTLSMPVTDSPITWVLGTANFWNGVNENIQCSWWEFWCEEETLIIGKGTSKKFNVATTTYEIATFLDVSKETIINACEEDSNFATEGICKTIIWLFYPEDNTGQAMINLTNSLGNKIPFAYIKLLNTKVNSISATNTPWIDYTVQIGSTTDQFNLGTIKIFDFPHAKEELGETTLNTITQWLINLMWIAFGIYIVSRIVMISSKI